MNLGRIRYYDRTFHPDTFRGTRGGWLIVVLNLIRLRIEVVIQKLVLKWLASQEGLTDREALADLKRKFDADMRLEEATMATSSPLLDVDDDRGRDQRYIAKRTAGTLDGFRNDNAEGGRPYRPAPLDELASRYGASGRGHRYARGKRALVTADDGDFDRVPPTDPTWKPAWREVHGRHNDSGLAGKERGSGDDGAGPGGDGVGDC